MYARICIYTYIYMCVCVCMCAYVIITVFFLGTGQFNRTLLKNPLFVVVVVVVTVVVFYNESKIKARKAK